ncbi:MAG: hypothetical protein IT233_00465 [Bacteroidia bacterium]|nr:hypothetical protein [Bacteroidia bacterium]
MKTNRKGITPLVLVPMLLLSMGANAQSDKEESFLGFSMADLEMMGMIALSVAAIVFLAWITTREKKKEPGMSQPVKRHGHHHHHHHRVHKLRR